jgi:hypothetical protein
MILARLKGWWTRHWMDGPAGRSEWIRAYMKVENMSSNDRIDVVDEMSGQAKDELIDRFFRIQTSTATREDVDQVKAFYVKRRLRGEVNAAWLERELGSLEGLWKTSKHYDGRF